MHSGVDRPASRAGIPTNRYFGPIPQGYDDRKRGCNVRKIRQPLGISAVQTGEHGRFGPLCISAGRFGYRRESYSGVTDTRLGPSPAGSDHRQRIESSLRLRPTSGVGSPGSELCPSDCRGKNDRHNCAADGALVTPVYEFACYVRSGLKCLSHPSPSGRSTSARGELVNEMAIYRPTPSLREASSVVSDCRNVTCPELRSVSEAGYRRHETGVLILPALVA